MTTMTDEYYHTLCDRFDALWRRREEQGGTLGPGRQEEFDRLGRAIIEACDELGYTIVSRDLTMEAIRHRAAVDDLIRDLEAEALPASRVPVATRVATERALDAACRELRIPRPRLVWLPADLLDGAGCDGSTPSLRSDVIYLSAGLDPARAAHCARHEARHCWQNATSRFLGPGECERDAEAWAWRR